MAEQLEVLLHGELAATLDTGRTALSSADGARWTPLIARLSAAWDTEPSLDTVRHWLGACLPENGARRPFEERATELELDLGLDPATSPPVDLLWANTDADYPGAVSFRRASDTVPDLDRAIEDLKADLADRSGLEGRMRMVTELMARVLQGALLTGHGPAPVAEAFCASRLAPRYRGAFGTLPKGCDLDAVIGRAMSD